MLLMMACGLGLVVVLRCGYEPGGGLSSSGLLLLLPAALYFTLNRFDMLPALLTALSLACLGRRWTAASALFLAAATIVKVYPVLLAPLVLRHLLAERRGAARLGPLLRRRGGRACAAARCCWKDGRRCGNRSASSSTAGRCLSRPMALCFLLNWRRTT